MRVVFGSQTDSQTVQAFGHKDGRKLEVPRHLREYGMRRRQRTCTEMDELSTLKKLYDVLIVVTSSYGDGDPPDNYNTFPAEKGDKPLATLYLVRAAPFTAIPSLARDA